MATRRGRPTIPDDPALRRIAEHLIDAEERGIRLSTRAAIQRACIGRGGHSAEATLRRLQRKWSDLGQALLAETRRSRAAPGSARRMATISRQEQARARHLTISRDAAQRRRQRLLAAQARERAQSLAFSSGSPSHEYES
jgi:hypothetical protein